ncbi:MAG: 2-succinyl-5-enolpyruvyl-6-hydroxy-3-cyclohexene-1-carboxylic-acid synthase [Candidatus Azobacteroides sp.]|nr:2-succinyl-5-enolpyruvyl-6-hydroxy-3-cyclohexene-1-carboxylic-acid synthase [Candidatus Azobacteroides sp.]
MYSDKKNILQLVALLKAHRINDIVLCPGSRNAPIIQTLANHPFFNCRAVTDERSAGFFAMGLALQSNKPAVVCCTSGTALLNIHPAVAEAFYQQIPLIVVSADRPAAWIGQADGQTLPQPDVFGTLVKKSVNLPEIRTGEDEWYCNRLINEALLETDHHGKGPVHINVPVSEPLFGFTAENLPPARTISRIQGLKAFSENRNDIASRWSEYTKCIIIAGQSALSFTFEKETDEILNGHFVLLAEHLNNGTVPGTPVKNFDVLLYAFTDKQTENLTPELLITYGGHVVSKRLKKFLRSHPPKEHWHISADGKIIDLYGSLTTVVEADPCAFAAEIASLFKNRPAPEYPWLWKNLAKAIPEPNLPYSEISAIGALVKQLPENSVLHLGNSSIVRYAQLFSIPDTVEVFCNRGTSGIEGSLSAAVGYASASDKLNFIVIGDLSFFYDMNALWNGQVDNNLRILLLNNGGGEIFQTLPGFEMTGQTHRFVTGTHNASAEGWAVECGFIYRGIHNEKELNEALPSFIQSGFSNQPMLSEVFTDKAEDVRLLKEYYHQIKNI